MNPGGQQNRSPLNIAKSGVGSLKERCKVIGKRNVLATPVLVVHVALPSSTGAYRLLAARRLGSENRQVDGLRHGFVSGVARVQMVAGIEGGQ
jgi:hypothetical protein